MTDTELLKVIKYTMTEADFDFCACGGFHYIGKYNQHAARCLKCKNLFCNGMTDISNGEIRKIHQKLVDRCVFIYCDHEYCSNGYCKECSKSYPMPNCEKCGSFWCCRDHCECECECECECKYDKSPKVIIQMIT